MKDRFVEFASFSGVYLLVAVIFATIVICYVLQLL